MLFSPTTASVALGAALLSTLVLGKMLFFGKPKWDPRGKRCVVTGGSAGLGLALAVLLVKRGAHVAIVARNEARLKTALAALEAARADAAQVLSAHSFAVDGAAAAEAALDAASAAHGGRCPDAVFLCAGGSRPGFWVEQSEEQLRACMDETYWVQAWPALAASKRMVREGVQGRIVFVASVLAYFSLVGYAPYSPGKFAVRGLAEALHSEFVLYGLGVHLCLPGTIFTPGYAAENEVKPKITLKLEEADAGAQPEHVAAQLLRGVERGRFHITYDFIGNVFRASTRGSSPGNHGLLDGLYNLIGAIALPLWRRDVDKQVRAHASEHHEYLRSKGLIATP